MSWLINTTDYSNATANISLQCEHLDQGVTFIWVCATEVFSCSLGFPAAVVILFDMFQKGRKGTPFTSNDVFILNLTILDVVYLLFLQTQLNVNELNSAWDAFTSFLYSFNLCGRPLFITCICLDCYLAVVHPVTYQRRKSLTPRILMAVGVWTVTVAYGCYITTTHVVSIGLIPILFFLLTLPVIGFCDLSILWTLTRSNPGGRDMHPQKKRALYIIVTNLGVILFSYLPPIITLLLYEFLRFGEKRIELDCLVTPVMCITVVGNTVSLILHLNNMGKLEWLRCWKMR